MKNNGYMRIVQKFRMWIYLSGIIAFTIAGVTKCVNADEINSPESFWPPDLIPHPHLPEPPPKEREMS